MLPIDRPLTRACHSFTRSGLIQSTSRQTTEVGRQKTDGGFLSCLASVSPLFRVLELAVVPDRQEAGVATQRLVDLVTEGVRLHLGYRFGEVVDLFQRVVDLLRIGTDLVE